MSNEKKEEERREHAEQKMWLERAKLMLHIHKSEKLKKQKKERNGG